MKVETYLIFDGRCDEALAYYRKTLGAEVTALMRFKDAPDQSNISPASKDKVMHSVVRIGDTTIMASDGWNQGKPSFQGFSLTISVPEVAEAERLFAALGDGGEEKQPLTETFFAKRFGIVADRFGVSWMILAAPIPAAPPKK